MNFGEPLRISDELESMSSMTLSEFMLRPRESKREQAFRLCTVTARSDHFFPLKSDMRRYIDTPKKRQDDEALARFRNSKSFHLGAERNGGLPVAGYINVFNELGEWQSKLSHKGQRIVVAPEAFFAMIQRVEELNVLNFETLFGIDWELWRGTTAAPFVFVGARSEDALRNIFQYRRHLNSCFQSLGKARWSVTDNWDGEFRPMGGDAWLAWLLLIIENNSYWDDGMLVEDDYGGAIMEVVNYVFENEEYLGGFDIAAPYISAGVPLEVIPGCIANDVPPDVASRLNA